MERRRRLAARDKTCFTTPESFGSHSSGNPGTASETCATQAVLHLFFCFLWQTGQTPRMLRSRTIRLMYWGLAGAPGRRLHRRRRRRLPPVAGGGGGGGGGDRRDALYSSSCWSSAANSRRFPVARRFASARASARIAIALHSAGLMYCPGAVGDRRREATSDVDTLVGLSRRFPRCGITRRRRSRWGEVESESTGGFLRFVVFCILSNILVY